MANRVVEILYRLKDLFSSQATKITEKYREIRRESSTTADRINRDNERLSGSFGSVISVLTRLRGLLIGGFAAGGATSAISNIANDLDRLGKTAGRLNIDPGLLAAYGFAAERSGIQVGVMEKALADLQRRIGESALGLGEARQAFERLGIDAEAFQQLGLERQMAILADRLSSVASEEERAALAAKLFGEAGVELLQALNGGSEELAELVRQGKAFSGVTKEQTDAAADFADAITNLTAKLKGFRAAIGGDLLQGITTTLGSFDLLASESANLRAQLRDAELALRDFGLRGGPPKQLEELTRSFERLSQAVADIEEGGQDPALVRMRLELAKLNDELAEASNPNLSNLFGVFGDSAEETSFKIMDLERAINDYTFAQAEAGEATKKEIASMEAARAENEKTRRTLEELAETQKGRADTLKETLKRETDEVRKARQEQLAIEREFAQLRKSITEPEKETSLVDVALKQRQASAALERGEAEKAIQLSREGADLLGRLKEQSGQSSVAMGFFAKQLEKVANQAAAQNVEKELLDAEKVKAEVAEAVSALGEIETAMKEKGAAAAKAFLDSFTQTMATTTIPAPNIAQPVVPAPRIVREGNSFRHSVREEVDARGRK